MNVSTIVFQVVMLALSSLGIAAVMEWYKKTVRGDKAKVFEIRIIAVLLSAIAGTVMNLSGMISPVIGYFWPAGMPWADMLFNAVVVFLLQLYGDMDLIKKIIGVAVTTALDKNALFSEVERFVKAFETSTNVNAEDAAKILHMMGVTPVKFQEILAKIGLSDEKAKELSNAFLSMVGEADSAE